jgi:hypothetical protein
VASAYLVSAGTILSTDYPYTSGTTGSTGKCNASGKTKVFNLVSPGSKKVTSSYDAFKAALLIEPINISFAVGNDFYNYKSGIYTGAQCET